MEFVRTNNKKRRPQKNRRRRYLRKKRLLKRLGIEVKSTKHAHWEVSSEYINLFDTQKILKTSTMQADAFWENYAIAQEWQKRHNVSWWRSRCLSLEYENEVLRNKVRLLAGHHTCPNTVMTRENNHYKKDKVKDEAQEENCTKFNSDTEDVEFNVTEDVLNFFETSERHRRQLKQKDKSNAIVNKEEHLIQKTPIIDAAESIRIRKQEVDLLYGDDSSKILAMETALQIATNEYKAAMNPQYWPNIPLKP